MHGPGDDDHVLYGGEDGGGEHGVADALHGGRKAAKDLGSYSVVCGELIAISSTLETYQTC